MPQRCVYILICVMDLLDKAPGRSAASGEKGGDYGSLPAAEAAAAVESIVRQVRIYGLMDPRSPPMMRPQQSFLLTEHWKVSRQGVNLPETKHRGRRFSPGPSSLPSLGFVSALVWVKWCP